MPSKNKKSNSFQESGLLRDELILQSIGEGICCIEPDGRLSFLNPAAAKLLGGKVADFEGQNYRRALFGDSGDALGDDLDFCPIKFALSDGETTHVNTETFQRPDGSSFLVEYICAPLRRRNKLTGAVVTFRDISERRDIELAISEARNSALESAKTKAAFLANMSHELRTPLNGIIGMSAILAEAGLTQEQQGQLEIIRKSSDLLLGIVNDILDYSKLEAGKIELEMLDFNLLQTLTSILEFFRPETAKKGLKIDLDIPQDIPQMMVGDQNRLRQIFNNLLSNAIKFTPGGRIEIKCLRAGDSDNGLRLKFSVSDTGIGISKEQQEKLFNPFTQADISTTRRFGGTGLGLAICRQLVSMMDGEIWIESEEGKGASFYFTAGFKKSSLSASSDSVSTKSAENDWAGRIKGELLAEREKIAILVAEDNEVNQQVIKAMLRSIGLEAEIAENGRKALAALRKSDFDIVLMDCQMPEMDGYQAAREIRLLQGNRVKTKIIAMTASALDDERRRCLEAGMDDYIPKPFDRAGLAGVFLKHLKQKKKKLDADKDLGQHRLEDILEKNTLSYLMQIEEGGEKNFLIDTLDLYIEHAGKQITDIIDFASRKEGGPLLIKAHSLKGSSGSVGLMEMHGLCIELEEIVEINKWELAKDIIAKISEEFERVKNITLNSRKRK